MTFAASEFEDHTVSGYDQPSVMQPAATPPTKSAIAPIDILPPWATTAITWGKQNLPIVAGGVAIALTIGTINILQGVTTDTAPEGGNLPVAYAPTEPGMSVEDARRQIETQILSGSEAHFAAANEVAGDFFSAIARMRMLDIQQHVDGTAPAAGASRLAVISQMLRETANRLDAAGEVPPGATDDQRRAAIGQSMLLSIDLIALGTIANIEDGKLPPIVGLQIDMNRGAGSAGNNELAAAGRSQAEAIDNSLKFSDSYSNRAAAKFNDASTITVPITPATPTGGSQQ